MDNTLSAINILIGDKLINKNNVPLLFYFSGEGNIIDEILSNDEFIQYLKEHDVFSLSVSHNDVATASNYFDTHISMFYYNNGHYEEHTYELEECYPLKDVKDELREMVTYSTIVTELNKMYERVMKKPYNIQSPSKSLYEYARSQYDEIKSTYGDRISPMTITNYIREQFSTQYNGKINDESVSYLVNVLTNILRDKI